MFLRGEGQKAEQGCRPKLTMPKPIRRQSEFAELFKGGRKTTLSNLSIWYKKTNMPNQLAVIISGKEGRAVKRNRARRLTREVIRKNVPMLGQGWRMAIKINAPLLDNYKEAEELILNLLYKAGLLEKDTGIND